jgi:hypothetical protein
MEKFKGTFGNIVDLDNPDTYQYEVWADFTVEQLYQECVREMGFALLYTQYWFPGTDWGTQTKRIHGFCVWFAREARKKREETLLNRIWFKKFLYRFQDEIENLC